MRTTVTLDDELMERARELTGIKERTVLLRMGLESLIAQASARRLARLGGTDPDAEGAPRDREPAPQ